MEEQTKAPDTQNNEAPTGDIFTDGLGLVPMEEPTPVVTDSEKPAEAPPTAPVEPEKPTEPKTEFNETEWLKEKTGGKYEKFEDLQKQLDDLSKTPKGSILEVAKKIDAVCEEKYGVPYSKLADFKNTNFDELNEVDRIVEYMTLNDPDITQEEIDAALDEFDILFKSEKEISDIKEDMSQSELEQFEKRYKLLNAKFITETRKATNKLKEFQSEISLEELLLQDEEATDNTPKLSKEEVSDYFYDSLKDYKDSVNLKTENGETVKIDIDLSDVDRKQLSNVFGDWQTWQSERWLNQDGSVNSTKMATDISRIINAEKREKLIYEQGIAAGQKLALKDINNIDTTKQIANSDAATPSIIDSIASDIINN